MTSRLATVPNRRKALFYLSQGLAFTFTPGRTRCQGLLYDELRKTFETAQRYNVNIHGIDPAGAAGYQRLSNSRALRTAAALPGRDFLERGKGRRRHDFLELLAEQTGGRPVTDSDDLEAAVAGIFEEYGSSYLPRLRNDQRRTGRKVPSARGGRCRPRCRGEDEIRTLGAEQKQRDRKPRPRAITCLFDCYHQPPPASDFHLVGLMPTQPLRMGGRCIRSGVREQVTVERRGDRGGAHGADAGRHPGGRRHIDDCAHCVR